MIYFVLSIISLIVTIILAAFSFVFDTNLYSYFSFLALLLTGAFACLYIYERQHTKVRTLKEELDVWNQISYHVAEAGDEAINNLPVGILVYQENRIKWVNDYLKNQLKSRLVDETLEDEIPALMEYINSKAKVFTIEIEGVYYQVQHLKDKQVLYFFDVTELERLKTKYDGRIKAIAMVAIDNYNQALKNLGYTEEANFTGVLLQTISDYFQKRGGYLLSFEDDRMMVVLDKEEVQEMIKDKFSILNSVREIASKNRARVSVSIGVACYDADAFEVAKNAQSAIESAEKRGGDQAVVNIQGEKVQYFGGKVSNLENTSLAEVRSKTLELKELVERASDIYITGHMWADADCFGAMIGILRMCMSSGKDPHIVLETSKADPIVVKLIGMLKDESPEVYDRIIPLSDVSIRTNSLLIICDTQSPSIMMFESLYRDIKEVTTDNSEPVKNVVVIDHHRPGEIDFDSVRLSRRDPKASSTVELVTEMISYYKDNIIFEPIEATYMLAGLIVDTNNFTFRTNDRTFEAAISLNNLGANMILAKTLLRNPFSKEIEMANAISKCEIFLGKYAIVMLDDVEGGYENSFLASVADKLMTIDGIQASFVLGRLISNQVGISARSYEQINVQRLMEQMGGGGHMTNAAVQLSDISTADAREKLYEIIKMNNEDEGEEKMKVILLQDVKGRGKKDEIIEVANGYGNYLLTNKLAVQATEENIENLKNEQQKAKAEEENYRQIMLKLRSEIESKHINVYIKVGADGKTFGHITSKQICEEFEAQTGHKLDKRKVTLPAEINSVGIFTATVDLYKDIQASIEIHVLEK